MSTFLRIVAGVAVLALLAGGKSRGRTGAGGPVRIDRMHAVDPDDHECSVCHARFTEDTMFCPRCGAGFTGRENNDDEFDFEMDELDAWDEEDEM